MSLPKTLFASCNLLGDSITQTPAIRRYKDLHPAERIVWGLQESPMRKFFEGMPEIGVCHEVFLTPEWDRLRAKAFEGYEKTFYMSCNEAFAIGQKEGCHISQAYGMMIDVEVSRGDILPAVPIAQEPTPVTGESWMVISPNSASNDKKGDGFSGNKVAPWTTWLGIFRILQKVGRVKEAVWLLGPEDPEPPADIGFQQVRIPLECVPGYLEGACRMGGLYAGVDNGITHMAAGLRIPTFVIYCAGITESWVSYSKFSHYRIAKVMPSGCRPQEVVYRWGSERLWG